MKIQYKNETFQLVNIRGKKLKPGESIVSQIFIKHFEEDVKNGSLSIYVDGAKISFEEISAITEQTANDKPGEIKGDGKVDIGPGKAGEDKDTVVPENPDVTPETTIETPTEETEDAEKSEEQEEISTEASVEESEARQDESAEDPAVEQEAASDESIESAVDDKAEETGVEAGNEPAEQESTPETKTPAEEQADSAE